MDKGQQTHFGHRCRVRQQFLDAGGAHLQDHQFLELVLFYCLPQQDVNPLAHGLMTRFGSLCGVMDAPVPELLRVPGISLHTVALLKALTEAARRYHIGQMDRAQIVDSPGRAAEVLRPCFIGTQVEMLYMLSLDDTGRIKGCDLIAEGSLEEVLMNQRQIMETALRHRACQVYLAHCHLNGMLRPSEEDVRCTKALRHILDPVGIRLRDHLIFANGAYVSLEQMTGCCSEGEG